MAIVSQSSIGEEIKNYTLIFTLGICLGAIGTVSYGLHSYIPKKEAQLEAKLEEEFSTKTSRLYDLIQEHMSADQQLSFLEKYMEGEYVNKKRDN